MFCSLLKNLKHQNERGEQFFSKTTLNPNAAASMFAPPKMPGSNMGKSVLLYDDSAAASTSSGLGSSISSSNSDSVLNMDLMQKQQLQKRVVINQDVNLVNGFITN